MVEDDTVHRSTKKNREAMYAFFQKYLDNPGSPEDVDVELSSRGGFMGNRNGTGCNIPEGAFGVFTEQFNGAKSSGYHSK